MHPSATALSYPLAIGSSLLAVVLTALLPLPPGEGSFVLALAAIVVTAWYGGRGPGWLALLISALTIDYFLVPPVGSFAILSWENAVGMLVFTVVAILLIELSQAPKRAEEALQGSEEKWRAVFEHNPTMYFMVDHEGSIRSVNVYGAAQLGYSIEELVGMPVLNLFHEADRDAVQQHVSMCLTQVGRPMSWEVRKVCKDGRVIVVRETAKAVRFKEGEPVLLVVCEDITDWKRVQEEIVQKASLLDLTHDTIFVRDIKNTILYWNRGAEERYGWTRGEAIGRVSHDLMATVFPSPLEGITEELFKTGRWEGELIHRKRDGSCMVVASRWSLQRDKDGQPTAILETNNDITDRKRAEQATGESEQRYRRIFQGAGVSILEEDFSQVKTALNDLEARGILELRAYINEQPHFVRQAIELVKIIDVNDATVRLFQAESKDKLLVSLHKIFLPETESVFAEELIAIAERRPYFESEAVLQTLDGKKITVLFTITFPPEASRYDRVLVTLTDITERKRAEEDRKFAEEAARKTQLELAHVARVTTLGEMTASIAHEINQPLGAIVNNAGACLRWLANQNLEEVRQSVEHVIRDAHRASQIISRIRALVRKAPAKKDWVNINDTIRDVLTVIWGELERRRVLLESHFAHDLPLLWGDRIQLQQVLLNIIMNAIEAMDAAGEGPRRLVIECNRQDAQHLLVTVTDTGPGIDASHLSHLFEAFYSTKPRGMGMGLAISRSIIEAHGGRLWAAANEPRGAILRFTLPIDGERSA